MSKWPEFKATTMQFHPLTLPRDSISRPVTLCIWWSLSVGISCPFVLCFVLYFQRTWIIELLPFTSRCLAIYLCIVQLHKCLKVNSQEARDHS